MKYSSECSSSYFVFCPPPPLQDQLMNNTLQTSTQTILLQNLEPCQKYWVTVTSVNCGFRATSNHQLIGLYDPTDFEFYVVLEASEECDRWLSENKEQALAEIRREIADQLSQCGQLVSCLANGTLSCMVDDQNVAVFQ